MRALMGRLTGPTGIPDERGGGEECMRGSTGEKRDKGGGKGKGASQRNGGRRRETERGSK